MAVLRKPPKNPGTLVGKKQRSPSKQTQSYVDNFAWNYSLPCKNPECKSHGKPHPNCRCYTPLAGGGKVGGFCDSARPHKDDCEYYMASGGEIDPSQVIPDSEPIDPSLVKVDEEIPNDQVQLDSDNYGSDEQHWKMRAEAAGRGVLGPIAPFVEKHLMGVDPKDIKGREEAYPIESKAIEGATFVGSLLTGTGLAGGIAKVAGGAAKAAELGKIGSMALKGAIEAASFAGSDETTKAILNQPGSDPETPVSQALLHVGAAGLMGGIGGSVFGLGEKMIGKGLAALENEKVVASVEKYLAKIGEDGDLLDKLGVAEKAKNLSAGAGSMATAAKVPVWVSFPIIKKFISKPIEKITGKLNDYATDGIIHCMLTNSAEGVPNAIHYMGNVFRGASKVNSAISSLFSAGVSKITPDTLEKEKEELREFIERGQVDQQVQNSEQGEGFAKGGMVSAPADHFSKSFPTQNMLLNAAKGRVSGYLNSIRPLPNQQKLPFDKPNPEKEKHREYDKALGFAVSPIKVLDHVNSGDLTPNDLKHFVSMYPEVHRHLSKKMTEKIMDSQLRGEMPTYKKRQAMSLFMGAPLDSSFMPQAIAAIQSVYAAKGSQQQMPAQAPTKSTSPLSKLAPSALTDAQARTTREQNQKA